MSHISLYPFYEFARGDKAILQHIRRVEYAPKDSRAWKDLGKVLSDNGYLRQAIKCFNESIESDPSNVEAWVSKGKAFFELTEYQDALACFDVVTMKLDPSNVEAWVNKGNIKYDVQSYEEALACYDDALELRKAQNEADSIIYYKKANCLFYLERDDKAIECYSESIRLDANKPIPYINRGLTLNRNGKYQQAEQDYKKALKLDPDNIAALRNLSYLYSDNLYLFDEALTYCRRLYDANPNVEWTTYLAETLIKAKMHEESRYYSQKVLLKIRREDILYTLINRFFIICSYLLEGKIANGREEFHKFLDYWQKLDDTFKIDESKWVFRGLRKAIEINEADPQVKSILENLIDLLVRNKRDSIMQLKEQMLGLDKNTKSQNLAEAIEELQESIRTNEELLEQKGYYAEYLNMDEQATENILPELMYLRESVEKLKTVSQFLKIDIDLPVTTNLRLAHLMTIEGKYEKALDIYNHVLKKEPNNLKALINKGVVLYGLRDYEEAEEQYKKVLSVEPNNIETIVNLGLLQNKMGKQQEAEDCYKKAAGLEPDEKNFQDLLYRGIALNKLGKVEEAILYFDRALKINPCHDRLLVNIGISNDALGRYEKARWYYDKALESNPRSVLALYNKACSFSLEGNKDEALQYLEEAIRLNPRFKDLAREDNDFKDLSANEMFTAITAPV